MFSLFEVTSLLFNGIIKQIFRARLPVSNVWNNRFLHIIAFPRIIALFRWEKRNNGPRLFIFEEIRYPVFVADVGFLITGDFQSDNSHQKLSLLCDCNRHHPFLIHFNASSRLFLTVSTFCPFNNAHGHNEEEWRMMLFSDVLFMFMSFMYILPQVIHCVGNIIAFRSDQPNWDKNLEFTF